VYFHELFQRGKRNLLKEIKRKNTDQVVEKGQKTPETVPAQGETSLSSLAYENQCIKQLYNEALAKISLFEGQLKQLTMQNQSLWASVRQKNQQNSSAMPEEKKTELTSDQLPLTLSGTTIPMLTFSQINQMTQLPKDNSNSLTKVTLSMGNLNSFLNHSKDLSTEASYDSPNLQAEETFTMPASSTNIPQEVSSQATQASFNPFATNTPYLNNPFNTQMLNTARGLSISRKEMSVGQLFEAWNSEGQGAEMFYFADQKKEQEKYFANVYQDTSVLGKRQNDFEANVAEPSLRRLELSVFSRRRMTSTATEENEGTVDMDLMDFRF